MTTLMRCDKRFQTFRGLKLRLHFCMDFRASSELIGYVDLTNSYEIWPKCSLVINALIKSVSGFLDIPNIAPFMRSHVAKIGKYSKYIFSATNRNIEKASHTFVVYHLLIDIVQFVWSCVQEGRRVIQLSKQCQFCV